MKIFLVGMGVITTQINLFLTNAGHSIVSQSGMFTETTIQEGKFDGIVVVGPVADVGPNDMVKAAEAGKQMFLVSDGSDPIYAWAASARIKIFPYPPSPADLENLDKEIKSMETQPPDSAEQYRNRVLGSKASAQLTDISSIRRKIVITSPKGGTGKTTVAVNAALLLAFCGIKTFLVDADANVGSMIYHLRIADQETNSSLTSLLKKRAARLESGSSQPDPHGLQNIVSADEFLRSFTPYQDIPALNIVPGVSEKDLNSKFLENDLAADEVMKGLFDAGTSANGVVLMDVGINPSNTVHRAALRNADAIAVVIKAEIPDIAHTRHWIGLMIDALAKLPGWSEKQAREHILSRINICYNMVSSSGWESSHNVLQKALGADLKASNLVLTVNGFLPIVPPNIADTAVNSATARDLYVWRFKQLKDEELAGFVGSLVGFVSNFMPIRVAAAQMGFIKSSGQKKPPRRGLFSRK